MTTDQNQILTIDTAEEIRHATQIATLRDIYRNTGRREFALLFIKSSHPLERSMLMAELEHLDLISSDTQS